MNIPANTRAAIASGRRFVCGQSNGGVVCLGKYAIAWCTGCFHGRGTAVCDKHVVDGCCSTCGSPVISFAAITETERQNEDRYEQPFEIHPVGLR